MDYLSTHHSNITGAANNLTGALIRMETAEMCEDENLACTHAAHATYLMRRVAKLLEQHATRATSIAEEFRVMVEDEDDIV